MFGQKTVTAPKATTTLPDGYDDPASFWYVAPEHRTAYVEIVDVPRGPLPMIREQFADHLREQERERLRADKVAEYMKRYTVDERTARKYLSDVRGAVILTREESAAVMNDYTPVNGSGWPDDAEVRVRHLYRRQTAADVVKRAKLNADNVERNRCPMCGEVDPSMKLANSHPLRGLVRVGSGGMAGPSVTCCDGCADVIRFEAAQLRAALIVGGTDGATVRDRARELIAAYLPQIAAAAGVDVPTPPNTLEALLTRAKR